MFCRKPQKGGPMIVKIKAILPDKISDDLAKKPVTFLDFNGVTDEMEEARKIAYMKCAAKKGGKKEFHIPFCPN